MLQLNGRIVKIGYFPDGSLLLKEKPEETDRDTRMVIRWNFENNEELLVLVFLTNHLRRLGYQKISLELPYIPNARQDRVKNEEDVFTLKYFAGILNGLAFEQVKVLDAHSNVSLALIDRVKPETPEPYIRKVLEKLDDEILLFYPDEGAKKRYHDMIKKPCYFGIKTRDWKTGQIQELEVFGDTGELAGRDVLIVDDICSYGGTFLHSAKKLKELGAADIYLFVTHLEHSVFQGELYQSQVIRKIFTTDSIFRKEEETDRIEVICL